MGSEDEEIRRESWPSSAMVACPRALLRRFDRDGDAGLNLAEFQDLCRELFDDDDVDRDEEFERIAREVFEIFDRNRDGVLSGDEWEICHRDWIQVVLNPVNVLLVIDVQNDFVDGSLALRNCEKRDEGSEVIGPINRLIRDGGSRWTRIVFTLDCHPEDHISFYENLHLREVHPDSPVSKEDAKPFDTVLFVEPRIEQKLWPKHCLIGTWGSQLHQELFVPENSEMVKKGEDPDRDSYSAFLDNGVPRNPTRLPELLRQAKATDLYVCGLAYDFCVRWTCLDGLEQGYAVALVEDCCRGVDSKGVAETRREVLENGGCVIGGEEVLGMLNGSRRPSLRMARKHAVVAGKA